MSWWNQNYDIPGYKLCCKVVIDAEKKKKQENCEGRTRRLLYIADQATKSMTTFKRKKNEKTKNKKTNQQKQNKKNRIDNRK